MRRYLLRAALAVGIAILLAPGVGLAQPSSESPTPGAWWATQAPADDATSCVVAAAWNQAMDAEDRAERELTTDGLAAVLQGSELAREQQVVTALRADGHALVSDLVRMWKIAGASADEAVVFATSTRLEGYSDPGALALSAPVWVENSQTAYRLARGDDGWRVTDQHVLEQHRHPADLAALAALAQTYRRLLNDALGAFSTGDFDNLDLVLADPALDDYRQRVQAVLETGKLTRISLDGTFAVLDLSNNSATAVFVGTATVAEVDPTTGTIGPASQQPYTVMHRLERQGADWKIAFEGQDSTQTDANGTVHIAGCA